MPLYEHVFLVRQDVSSQQVEALVDQFKSIIEESGGSVGKVENWGLKTLTYRIRKNRKAHFTLMNIEAGHEALAEVERQQRLSEDVLRSLTLKVDQHEDGPSAMLQKREDRDRRGRPGDRPRREPRRSDGEGSAPKTEAAAEAKSEAKPEAKSEAKSEDKSDAKPATTEAT